MFILFISITTAFGLNTSLFIDNEVYEQSVLMNAQQQTFFQQFEDYGKILSINFAGNDQSNAFCKPFYQGISIISSPEGLIPLIAEQAKKNLDDLSEDDLYIGYNEKLISQAKSPEGICLLSTLGKVYLIEFQDSNKIQLKNYTLPPITKNQEIATLIYDEKSRFFFAFLKSHEIIKFQFYKEQLNTTFISKSQWRAPQKQFKFVASNGWLYCAQEEEGLLIYQILHNEILLVQTITSKDIYNKTLDNFSIIDIQVFEDKLYILDAKNGVSQFNIFFNGTYTKNEQFGIINLSDCHSFSVSGNTMIVIQNFKSSSQVIEYYITDYEWLEIRKYYTKSRLQKANIIDDNLVIVIGQHDHKILLTKMADQYLDRQNHQLENYFFLGNLLGVEKYGENNDTLFAISPHGFYFFTYEYFSTAIVCNSNDAQSGLYKTQMTLKSTDCEKKTNKEDNLQYCQTNFNYNFEIKKPLLSAERQQQYFYFGIFIILIIVLLLYMIGYYYNKQKQNQKILEEIKKKKRNINQQQR
ncbi:unnamed protein product [Paramecium sonneborni]|uniref:Transmembrane protein n=1 Tax=Paramecium sonneborni TaxID=65129 RepID=A0A8S1R9R4_9CILI|nr:unnamed protein product [Paramecium sonneborni]